MLRSRIIPCLLIHNGGLVKTTQFGEHKYVGDPLNAVRIFNEKEVDEIVVLDIDATVENREPDYDVIASLASECRMPLCYGGGVKTLDQAERIIGMGVEKIAVGSLAVENESLVSEIARVVGSQSVVGVLDVKKTGLLKRYECWLRNATVKTGQDPVASARRLQELGVGEIFINSIDNDGKMTGYDIGLIRQIYEAVEVPITALGGAGSLEDIRGLIDEFGLIGCGAGSLFVFKGVYRAVLINYPNSSEKLKLFA